MGEATEKLDARRIRREFYDYIKKIEERIPRDTEKLLSQEFVEIENSVVDLPGIIRASIERTLSEIAGTRVFIETDPKNLPPGLTDRPFYNVKTQTIHIPPSAGTGLSLKLIAEHEARHHRQNIKGAPRKSRTLEEIEVETDLQRALLRAINTLAEKYARLHAEHTIMPGVLPETRENFLALAEALTKVKDGKLNPVQKQLLAEALTELTMYALLPVVRVIRTRRTGPPGIPLEEIFEAARRIVHDYVKLAEPIVRRVPKIVEELLKGNTETAEKLFTRAHKKALRLAAKRGIPVTVAHLAALETIKILTNELKKHVGPEGRELFLDTYWRLISRATKRYVRALRRYS